MKYKLIDRATGEEEMITKKEVLKIISKYYTDPKFCLENLDRPFGYRIRTPFFDIEKTD